MPARASRRRRSGSAPAPEYGQRGDDERSGAATAWHSTRLIGDCVRDLSVGARSSCSARPLPMGRTRTPAPGAPCAPCARRRERPAPEGPRPPGGARPRAAAERSGSARGDPGGHRAHPGRAARHPDRQEGGIRPVRRGRLLLLVLGRRALSRSAFRQRGSISLVLRTVPVSVPALEDLGLPPVVARLADEERGIVLVTGATGSGKSTTLAAMIDRINRVSSKHVVTVEDPIEMLHGDRRSIINQREVGTDTGTFADALRRVLRQDPDVIMIGEIRACRPWRDRAERGRDGPPGALHHAHRRRDRDGEPHGRLLPPAPAEAGAGDAGRHAPGRHLATAIPRAMAPAAWRPWRCSSAPAAPRR